LNSAISKLAAEVHTWKNRGIVRSAFKGPAKARGTGIVMLELHDLAEETAQAFSDVRKQLQLQLTIKIIVGEDDGSCSSHIRDSQ
jgi:hypothetical protein